MSSKKLSAEELARAGIYVEVPKIEVPETEAPQVEPVNAGDLSRVASEEAFMNELVRIRVATTTDPNAPPHAIVTVNSTTNRAVIPRGVPMYVKRMHVEVLARMRETRYTQPARNPMDPEPGNQLIPHNAIVYPFEVLEDKNPLGREWLERIMGEPA